MVRVVRVELTISSAQARRLTIKPLPIWSPVKESNLFLSASKAKVWSSDRTKWLTELGSNQCLTRYERIALPLSYQSINGGSRRNWTSGAFWELLYRQSQPTNSCLTSRKMVCSTGLEPVSFALQASAMTSSAKNTWWSIRESNSFTISLQKKSAAHSYTPNRMEPCFRIELNITRLQIWSFASKAYKAWKRK